MCGVCYQHELDQDNGFEVEIFGSVQALKKNMSCTDECGIVKVSVTLEKWVKDQEFKDGTKTKRSRSTKA